MSTQQYQTIVINGSGFGTQAPYTGDSSYILFQIVGGWSAGYAGPCFEGACDDLVTLIVTTWTDSEIVLGGFAGAWGSNGWTLASGEQALFYVWNAQSGAGPASLTTPIGAQSLQVATTSLPNATSGAPYSTTLTASGGSGTGYAWSLSSGSLPTGFTLSSAGVLASTGSPAAAPNSYSFTVQVTDSASDTATQQLTLDVMPAAASLAAVPSALTFNYEPGGALPASQTLSMSSSGAALAITATASSGGNWLLLSPTNAVTPVNLTVAVNPAGLAAGSYSGTITLTSAGASNSPLKVPVTLNVAAPPVVTAEEIEATNGCPSASAAKTSFLSTDYQVWFDYTYTGGYAGDKYLVEWFEPNGTLYVTANYTQANTGGTYCYNYFIAIAGYPPAEIFGTWTVKLIWNATTQIAAAQFTISAAEVSLAAAPASLTFTYQQGGTQPAAQALAVSSSGGALPFTATASTTNGSNWLSVTPESSSTPASLAIAVNTNGLAAGSYSGTVKIASSGAINSPLTVPVTLTIVPAATLVVSPVTLTFPTYQIGGAAPQPQTVSVTSNPASSVLSFNVVPGAGCAWLALSANSAVTPATITAAVNTTGLTAQTYNCTFSVAGGAGAPAQVSVSMIVAGASFTVTPASLAFSYQTAATTAPASLPIAVTAAQSFTAAVSTTSGGPWLSVSPSGGSGGATATSLSVSVNPTGLAVGTYNGAVGISSGGGTQNVFVALTVSGPALAPSPLAPFIYLVKGGAPASQNLTVVNSFNSQPVSFTASSACPWLTPLPSTPQQEATLTPNISVLSGYTPGTYNCTVTVASALASSLSVPLTLIVSPANLTVSPAGVSFNVEQGSRTPLVATLAVNAPATPGFSAPPVSFTASVTGCASANWLSVSPAAGNAPANLTLLANPNGLNASPAPCQVTVIASQGQQPPPVNVTLTLSQLPTLIVAPSQVSFHFTQNTATLPPPQVVSVLASGDAQIAFDAATSGQLTSGAGSQTALHVSNGPGSGNISISVISSALAPGFYTGTVTVNSAQTNPAVQTVPVSVLVDPPPQAAPVLTVGPASLTFAFSSTGNGNGASQLLTVQNQGGGSASVTAAASTAAGGNWLSVTSGAAQVTGAAPASIAVTANPAAVIPNASGQVAGTYTGSVLVTADGLPPLSIPVTMTVSALPIVQLSRTGLTYTVVLGGNDAPPESVSILNPGAGTLNWAAQAGQSGCGDWLTFRGGAIGSVGAGAPAQLQVGLNGTAVQSQAAGTYYCSVTVSAQDATSGQVAANSPQTVTVALNLLPEGTYISPFVQPGGYVFTGTAGSTVPPAQITIVSPTQQPVSYSSAAAASDGGSWCTVSPEHGSVTESVPVLIAADYTKLTGPSTYTCTVQLSFSDGSLQTVSLFAIVTDAGATPASAGRRQARAAGPRDAQNCTPLPPVFLNPVTGFNAIAYQPMEVDLQIEDSCGNPIDSQSIGVLGLFSTYSGGNYDPAGDFQGPYATGPGTYKFEWTPTRMPLNVSQSAVTLTAAYTSSAANLTPLTGNLSGTVSLTPNPTYVDAGGIANAASFTSQVAVGAIIAIFGGNLADGESQANQVPLPTSLEGTKVLVNGQAVPLFYASSTQINAQLPYNLPPNAPQQLIVVRDNTQTNPQTFTLVEAQPAIFTTNAGGYGQGAIVGPDNITLADASHPVSVGDIAVIYCAGLGPVTPTVVAGNPTPPSSPLPQVPAGLTVTIGNVQATDILYAGLSPDFVGLYQVNVRVPDGVQAGDAVPVTITVGNLQSQPGVTMAVQ